MQETIEEKTIEQTIKEIKVEPNIVDKFVNFISPVKGLGRMKSRYAMAIAGAYVGASRTRTETKAFRPGGGDANEDSLWDIQELRNRSSWHLRNTPIASGAVNTNCTHVIGPGLKMQSRIDADFLGLNEDEAAEFQDNAEREFRLCFETTDCDVAGRQNIYGIQNLTFRSPLERGDAFLLFTHKERKGIPYSLQLQVIEADRVCNEKNKRDTKDLIAGIEMVNGVPKKIHVRTTHPGDTVNRTERKWVKIPIFSNPTRELPIPRRNISHIYDVLRPDQARGIPYISGIIEQLYQLNKGINGEVAAMVIQSYYTAIMRMEDVEEELNPLVSTNKAGATQKKNEDWKLAPGGILKVKNVEDIKFADPTHPNSAFIPFLQGMMEMLGPYLGLPHEMLIQHFTKSFTAASAAMLLAWKGFNVKRANHIWQVDGLAYEAMMLEAVLRGRIVAPGFLTSRLHRNAYLGALWVGPTPGAIDPTKTIKAARERIELKLTSRSGEGAAIGEDWEKNIAQIKREEEMLSKLPSAAPASLVSEKPAGAETNTEAEVGNVDDANETTDGRDDD